MQIEPIFGFGKEKAGMEVEAETKTSVDEVKENLEAKIEAARVDLPSTVDSVVKPLVEGLAKAEKSLIESVAQSSSSYATEVERQVEGLVSDPWASLKNLGAKNQTSESSAKETEETLPTSDENVGASSDDAKSASDDPRSTHTQPFVAVSATTRSNGEEDRNMPLKDSTETKMGCQERRGGRMGSWSEIPTSLSISEMVGFFKTPWTCRREMLSPLGTRQNFYLFK